MRTKIKSLLTTILMLLGIISLSTYAESELDTKAQQIEASLLRFFDHHIGKDNFMVINDPSAQMLVSEIAENYKRKDQDEFNQLLENIQNLMKWRYMESSQLSLSAVTNDHVDYQLIYFAFLCNAIEGGEKYFNQIISTYGEVKNHIDSGIDQSLLFKLREKYNVSNIHKNNLPLSSVATAQ